MQWEAPGHIWYESLKASTETTQFQDFADTTYLNAGALYGAGSAEQQAVLTAWREVGIRITGAIASGGPARGRNVPPSSGPPREPDGLAALAKQVAALSAQ